MVFYLWISAATFKPTELFKKKKFKPTKFSVGGFWTMLMRSYFGQWGPYLSIQGSCQYCNQAFFFFLFQNLGNIGTIFAYLDRSACYTVDNRILNEYANISSSDQKIYDSCTYYAPLCGLSPFPLNTTKCRVLMRELIHILVFTHILVESCDIV